MKSLPYWFLGIASLFAVAGMVFGIYMSGAQDITLSPAHAHSNLVGFVTMAIFGLFYKAVPSLAVTRLAKVHFIISLVAAVTFGPGIGMAVTGNGEVLAIVSSILVIISMGIFAYTVWSNKTALSA